MTIYLIGTWDTKGTELAFLRDRIRAEGLEVRTVDVSTGTGGESGADVAPNEVLRHVGPGPEPVDRSDRGAAVAEMSRALVGYLLRRPDVGGVLGIGGSGGTALVAPALRALPLGVPKLLLSTVASGNVAPYVGASDIAMMYSVTDILGLNRISRPILANAAGAIAGMVRAPAPKAEDREAVALTMFGVTTPCVTAVAAALGSTHDTIVFHATGTGGEAFEKLADSRLISAGIDVTTTEVADFLVGGVFPCTGDRFGAFARTGLPWVGSVGALDMVNFGALDTVPIAHRDRRLYVHNANVTLMRTTPDECGAIGSWIAARLNRCDGPVHMLLPEGGVSAIDRPGGPFHDPVADEALFAAIETALHAGPRRTVERLPYHINDPGFAEAVTARARPYLTGKH